jgi:hypothetical protein
MKKIYNTFCDENLSAKTNKKKRHKKLNAVKDEKRGTNEHMLI